MKFNHLDKNYVDISAWSGLYLIGQRRAQKKALGSSRFRFLTKLAWGLASLGPLHGFYRYKVLAGSDTRYDQSLVKGVTRC